MTGHAHTLRQSGPGLISNPYAALSTARED